MRTFKQLMEFTLATIERRRFFPVPFALLKLQAAFLQSCRSRRSRPIKSNS